VRPRGLQTGSGSLLIWHPFWPMSASAYDGRPRQQKRSWRRTTFAHPGHQLVAKSKVWDVNRRPGPWKLMRSAPSNCPGGEKHHRVPPAVNRGQGPQNPGTVPAVHHYTSLDHQIVQQLGLPQPCRLCACESNPSSQGSHVACADPVRHRTHSAGGRPFNGCCSVPPEEVPLTPCWTLLGSRMSWLHESRTMWESIQRASEPRCAPSSVDLPRSQHGSKRTQAQDPALSGKQVPPDRCRSGDGRSPHWLKSRRIKERPYCHHFGARGERDRFPGHLHVCGTSPKP